MTKATQRNQAIDLLRIVSSLGIIWYHAGISGNQIAYSGLVVFILLSPIFEASRTTEQLRSPMALARRLLVPWAIWTCVYAVFNVVRGRPPFPTTNGWLAGILIGSGEHLWFLPFMFAFLSALVSFRKLHTRKRLAYLSLACASVGMATMIWWRPWSLKVGYPIAQYLHALPPAFLGASIGAFGYPYNSRFITLLLLAMPTATLFLPVSGGLGYAAGTILVLMCHNPKLSSILDKIRISTLAGATFGIYLIHQIALSVFWPLISNGWGIAGVSLAFLFSAALVVATKLVAPKFGNVVFG